MCRSRGSRLPGAGTGTGGCSLATSSAQVTDRPRAQRRTLTGQGHWPVRPRDRATWQAAIPREIHLVSIYVSIVGGPAARRGVLAPLRREIVTAPAEARQ